MSACLDTNACIAAIGGHPRVVRERMRWARRDGHDIVVSAVTVFELWFGVANGARVVDNTVQLDLFLDTVDILPFDDEDARVAGFIRADLKQRGTPIAPYDCLIAAQALRRDLTLVTANIREFARVEGLRIEDWSRDL